MFCQKIDFFLPPTPRRIFSPSICRVWFCSCKRMWSNERYKIFAFALLCFLFLQCDNFIILSHRIVYRSHIEFRLFPPQKKHIKSGSNASCRHLTPIRKRTVLSRKLMKTNLSFLNKFEEDAYQKLISGLNGKRVQHKTTKLGFEGKKKANIFKIDFNRYLLCNRQRVI